MKQIVIKFIQDFEHREGMDTADWFFEHKSGDLVINVTDMGDWRYNLLVARHELDEAVLCKFNGITTEQVDKYCELAKCLPADPDSFSGYPKSPHQAQHNDSLAAEWVMSRLLGVDWTKYSEAFYR